MRCPTLADLPPPTASRTGWPWTVETPPQPALRADGTPWPRISIVTPSLNQGQFIEETIRSVLLQGYPDLEYIVIDGGSNDASAAIIGKYERWLSYWVSEPDRGQAHAINNGLQRSSGDIFHWINSDDVLAVSALARIGESMRDADVAAGGVLQFDCSGHFTLVPNKNLTAKGMILSDESTSFHQPGVWIGRKDFVEAGGLDESLRYAFDWLFFLNYFSVSRRVRYLDEILVHFRLHSLSKTIAEGDRFTLEGFSVLEALRETGQTAEVRNACVVALRTYMRRFEWSKFIRSQREAVTRSRAVRALVVLLAAFADPKVRLTRFTLGAVRRILLSSPG